MQSREVVTACEIKAGAIAASAARQSGTNYVIDSMRGLTRNHTRVSTSGSADFFRERQYGALRIAVSTAGGKASGQKGYKSVTKANRDAMRRHEKAVARRRKGGGR